MNDFEKMLRDMFSSIWDCEIDHPLWQDTVGEIMTAVIQAHEKCMPKPQEGHWIKHETPDGGEQYECSRCGVLWEFNDGTPEDNEAYFCPKCGSYNGGGRK